MQPIYISAQRASGLRIREASSSETIYAIGDDIPELKTADITISNPPGPEIYETIFHEIPGLVHDCSGLTYCPGNHTKATIIVYYAHIVEFRALIFLHIILSLTNAAVASSFRMSHWISATTRPA